MTRKAIFAAALAASVLLAGGVRSKACTNIIVTRGASADNSNIVSYAADSHVLYGELYFHPAAVWKAGSMLDVVDWDTNADPYFAKNRFMKPRVDVQTDAYTDEWICYRSELAAAKRLTVQPGQSVRLRDAARDDSEIGVRGQARACGDAQRRRLK